MKPLSRTYLLILIFFGFYSTPGHGLDKSQASVKMEKEGLSNFHRVSKILYRGAQPTAKGFQELKSLGIKTDVNLRSFHSDRREAQKAGLNYEHIYMKAWHPEKEDVIRFLEILGNEGSRPVFVHCEHGADRTGSVVAVYRIVACNWSKEEAIREMVQGSYGFHPVWGNLIEFIRDLDVEALKQKLSPSARRLPCD